MEISGKTERKASPTGAAIDIAIRLGVLAVLVAWCFQILRPFVSPIVWGIIIAVALYPVYQKLNVKLGDRRKLTAACLWALICLILAIIQIGIVPVIIPVIIYAFSKMSTLTAVMLTVWLVLLAISDGPLKAVLMGRGASVPMLVIFLGAIGGFISFGFLGLFIGAVILSVGYKLLEVWLQEDAQSLPVVEASGPAK
jgi:predicted PurR-regulated permease PerM